ncbi:MAG: site-specific DNA-methyltransferase [Chloroflexi bacterium OHK40]
MTQQLGLFNHFTHKANLKQTRYGWLRLTPAYSVHLVEDILDDALSGDAIVLDPFCGTGTTALVCAERGIPCTTTDINPFLLWLTATKTQSYSTKDLTDFMSASEKVIDSVTHNTVNEIWTPPIHQLEKWWDHETLHTLGNIMHVIHDMKDTYSSKTLDILKIAFCRVLIIHSSASFNHQSMSFKKHTNRSIFDKAVDNIKITWEAAVESIYDAAHTEIRTQPGVHLCDAKQLSALLPHNHYTHVITSPPYPNRMSYIRELRPYMYWLGYLKDGREAGELDWQAIGGTWGIATSNTGKWSPPTTRPIPYAQFPEILGGIATKSDILSRYVHKYFYDMVDHISELLVVTKSGGSINYIVGNSKFYDIIIPTEEVFAALFKASGFVDINIKPIRKRTSKKELYEYIVSARKV